PESPEGRLGAARFRAECCLRGLTLNGQPVTTEVVVKDFQAARATLELARFKAECCLRELLLNDRPVTPDAVVADYQAAGATLELARFRAECCLRGLLLNGQPVTTEVVVRDFQAVRATLELARFKADCCLKGLPLNGQQIAPEAVVRGFPGSPEGKLGILRFKQQCCLRNLSLNGRQVTPDAVVKDFPNTPEGRLGIAHFKEHCCLRGLLLNGQPVTPEAVVKDFPDTPEGKLATVRFKAECCLKGLPLNGQPVTPEAVARGYQADKTLELARFKAECCLKGLRLNSQPVTPEAVVKDYQSAGATLELARFKAECCLKGLLLNNLPVTPEAVVKDYQAAKATLELARFKEQCCLRGLPLNGQPVTPEAVVKNYQAVRATLELARFKAECCLRGLLLNSQQITPEAVVKGFPDSPEGKLAIARFKEECCLRGLLLNGRQVTPEAVVKDFQAARATLELARFKAECCLRGLPLNGQRVTPEAVVKGLPDSPESKLAIARFKGECCLRDLPLNGQPVTPDAVIKDFPDNPEGKLGKARFKERCCLRGLLLNGLQVTPEAVVKNYERGGWLLEKATFYAQLALNARELNGSYLDNQTVLAAFNAVSGDHSSRQTRYLIQRLRQSQPQDETSEARDIHQQAWQILNNVPVKDDEQYRLQCILKFMAMQNELTIDHQHVSAEQVLQSIKTLRSSFRNLRLRFFFLAHCHIKGQSICGRKVHQYQVLKCLQNFPERSKLRHALGRWFEQSSAEANIMDKILFKRENTGSDSPDRSATSAIQHKAPVTVTRKHFVSHKQSRDNAWPGYLPSDENRYSAHHVNNLMAQILKPGSKTGEPGFPDHQAPRLNALTLHTLEIIQEINGSYPSPTILITGSYARFLQNFCSRFNDIDIICATEASARTLFGKLQALNTDRDAEIPTSIIIAPIPGCPEIQLPGAYSIQLLDGDLGTKAMGLQVNVDARITHTDEAPLAVHVPGVERPVRCLSFTGETRLLNDTLAYLADNLDPLTKQLKKGEIFQIPRTILFNFPQNLDECIYGLLMRSLLTLNKAREFLALHCEKNHDYRTDPLQEQQQQQQQQRLHTLTANLQMKLASHAYRNDFELRVNDWLATSKAVNDYLIKRQTFIKALLAMMHAGLQ
ncbi:hypothetical protein, partial [Endozoicomonas sp. SESOKO1]|uniref:hypothetical protein n=1 Tax=Endozoicomonas sp. SESOKO1 TaxID=2828742 RepID=UPI00214771FC